MPDASQYTDPVLREQVKAEVLAGDKGGRAGQWSARKAQLVARLYKERGGDYTADKAHEPEAARHLDRWTQEDWQTADGSAQARDGDVTHRYLPKEAWDRLSDEEKEATDRAKTASDDQFVANTDAAKEAREAAELLTLPAPEAQRRVRAMSTRSALEKARAAEQEHGKARTTVLRVVEQRLRALD